MQSTPTFFLATHLDCDLYKLLVQFPCDSAEIHRTEPILPAGSPSCFPHTWLLLCACCPRVVGGFNVTWALSNREGQR